MVRARGSDLPKKRGCHSISTHYDPNSTKIPRATSIGTIPTGIDPKRSLSGLMGVDGAERSAAIWRDAAIAEADRGGDGDGDRERAKGWIWIWKGGGERERGELNITYRGGVG